MVRGFKEEKVNRDCRFYREDCVCHLKVYFLLSINYCLPEVSIVELLPYA